MSGSRFISTSIAPGLEEPDPGKHVNYVLGMVLGVDDFRQEFGYLAGRTELAARELAGYGTVRGLRVSSPTLVDPVKGTEVTVSAGIALTPRGQFVRVPLTQCAFLDAWINDPNQKRRELLAARGVTVTPTASGKATLYVVLTYADHKSDLVPIPGEPCRTEDESMKPSRITDDFKLELRLDRPEEREQNAIEQYLRWLRTEVVLVDAGGLSLSQFLAAIATAAAPPAPATPTPPPPPTPIPHDTPIFTPSALPLQIPRADAERYLRAAFRYFSTLRAEWQGSGAVADGTPPNEEAVLLARLELAVEISQLTATDWHVSAVAIDESVRPVVLPLSYLQEVIFALAGRAAQQFVPATFAPRGYLVAAAGTVRIKANEADAPTENPATANGLTAWASAAGEVSVTFAAPAAAAGLQYVVKVLPVADPGGAAFDQPTVAFGAFRPGTGFTLLVRNGAVAVPMTDLVQKQLMIEVSGFAV